MAATTARSTDPIVFARDANNQLEIPLRKAAGLEAILILVRCAWLLFRDEYFLNRGIGVPYLETEDGEVTDRDAILGEPYDPARLARGLRDEALAIPGVADVAEFKSAFDPETRNASVSAVVVAAFADGPAGSGTVLIAVSA